MSMFDFSKYGDEETLPTGEYPLFVDSVELKATKRGGEMVALKLKVLDGNYREWVLFHNFNVKNDNPQAVEVGMKQLKRFLVAAKLPLNFTHLGQLIGARVLAQVGIEHHVGFGKKNKIEGFKPLVPLQGTESQKYDNIPF